MDTTAILVFGALVIFIGIVGSLFFFVSVYNKENSANLATLTSLVSTFVAATETHVTTLNTALDALSVIKQDNPDLAIISSWKARCESLQASLEASDADRAILIVQNEDMLHEINDLKDQQTVDLSYSSEFIPEHDLEGLVSMFEEAFEQFEEPITQYEIGVYNGVVAIANTLCGDLSNFEALPVPPVIPAVVMPKRDAKGRFLKVVASK